MDSMKFTRPESLASTTTKVPTGYGNLYITITEHDGKPFEIFCSIGKSGASVMAKAEVTGRLASLALRNGVPVQDVIKQLIDIAGGEPRAWKTHLIKSIPDAVGRVLSEKYLNKKEVTKDAI
jgi:ribonucleoside-diphosphate reductase alpha chain